MDLFRVERAEMNGIGSCPCLDRFEEITEEAAVGLGIDAKGVHRCVCVGAELALLGCCGAMVAFAASLLGSWRTVNLCGCSWRAERVCRRDALGW